MSRIVTRAGEIHLPDVHDPDLTDKLHITWHWSAGSYNVTDELLTHYHFVLDHEGRVHEGVPVEKNLDYAGHPRQAGYAAHVRNANTNNIAVSAAAMATSAEYEARQGRYGEYPMTPPQVQGLVEVAAHICRHFGIPILPTRVLGHEEWDSVLGRPQDRWDVNCIPHLDIRPRKLPDGTYASTNWLRQQTRQRLAELGRAEAGRDELRFVPEANSHLAALYELVPKLWHDADSQRLARAALNDFNDVLVDTGLKPR